MPEFPEFLKWIYEHPWGTAAIVVCGLGLVCFVWFAVFNAFRKAITAVLRWVGFCIALVLVPGLHVFAFRKYRECCPGGSHCVRCTGILAAELLAAIGTACLLPVAMMQVSEPERMLGTSVPGWPFGLWLAEIIVSIGVCWIVYIKRRERARLDAYALENAELDLELAQLRGEDEQPTEATIAAERSALLHDIADTEAETVTCDAFVALVLRWEALKRMTGEAELPAFQRLKALFRNMHLGCKSRKQTESQFMEQLRKAFQKPPE
jgi:hypothetical protein